MELQDAVLEYRGHVGQMFRQADPRLSDEWIADKVDELVPLDAAGPPTDRPQFKAPEKRAT